MKNWWGKKIATTFCPVVSIKKYIPYVIMTLSFIGVIFIFTDNVKAADDQIVINEIYSHNNSGDPSDKEWIELYNPTASDIDLTGWTIKDGSTTVKNLAGYGIEADGYLILTKGTDFTFSLNDDGDR